MKMELGTLFKTMTASAKFLLGAFILSTFSFVYVAVGAPPGSPYNLGETLAPTCAPGDANCTVVTPLQSGANSSATLGIGTASAPDGKVEIDVDTTTYPDGWGSLLKLTAINYPAMWFHAENNNEGWIIGNNDGTDLAFMSTDGTSAGDYVMVITEGGNLGIGTTVPFEKLTAVGDNADADLTLRVFEGATTENSSVFMDFAEGTSGAPSTPADGQTVAHIVGRSWDGSAFQEIAAIQFLTDGGTSANDAPGRISFSTTTDGATVPAERLNINEDGQFFINPANVTLNDEELHIGDEVAGSSDTAVSIQNDSHVYEIHVEDSDEFVIYENENEDSGNSVLMYNGSTDHWGFGTDPTGAEITTATGATLTTGGVWTDSSSRELKTNIFDLSREDAMRVLEKLEPVRFEYKRQPGEEYLGFIAEDVPELVATNDRKGLGSMDIVAVLTKVVQDQQERINRLEQALRDLGAL